MDTKEAIEWLDPKTYIKEINEVIELLKRGEKYEAIVKDLKEEVVIGTGICANWLRTDIKRLEQKYFLEASDNFTKKVMEKINKKGER